MFILLSSPSGQLGPSPSRPSRPSRRTEETAAAAPPPSPRRAAAYDFCWDMELIKSSAFWGESKNKEHILCFMFILEVFLNYKSAQVNSSSQSDTGEGQNTPLLYVIGVSQRVHRPQTHPHLTDDCVVMKPLPWHSCALAGGCRGWRIPALTICAEQCQNITKNKTKQKNNVE